MYIKDTYTGNVRKYGTDQHDSLRISNDGTCLTYEHLQCGDGSIEGDKEHSGFLFCDDEGYTPEEDEVLCRYSADTYFNIGGWEEPPKWIPVSERFPEESNYCLCCDKDGYITIGYIPEWSKEWIFEDDDIFIDVVAWMPLPEPYKVESEGQE